MTPTPLQRSFAEATNMILDHAIPLVEWGDQVLLYWGYPTAVSVYDFLIPDSLLQEAVNHLEGEHTGFELIDPPLSERAKGTLGSEGYHFVSKDDQKMQATILHLMPMSLVHLKTSDCFHVSSPFDPSHGMFRPKLAQHCISLMKCMEDYPGYLIDRLPAERALRILLTVAVYEFHNVGAKIYVPEEETETEEVFQARQQYAIAKIEGWDISEEDESYRGKLIKFLKSEFEYSN